MTITAEECIKQIKQAIRLFGTYTYGDKGPREVMDIETIVQELRSMPLAETKELLEKVVKYDVKNQRGHALVSAILVSLQDLPDDQFEELAKVCPDW